MAFLDPFSFNRGFGGGVLGAPTLTTSAFDPFGDVFDLTNVLGMGLPLTSDVVGAVRPVASDITRFRDVSNVGTRRDPNTIWVDVYDDAQGYHLCCDIPGVRKEDVKLTVTGRNLIILFRRYFTTPEQGVWRRHERDYGTFRRTLRLPKNVDLDKITATIENGQLLLFIPKTAGAEPKRIAVEERGQQPLLQAEKRGEEKLQPGQQPQQQTQQGQIPMQRMEPDKGAEQFGQQGQSQGQGRSIHIGESGSASKGDQGSAASQGSEAMKTGQ